MNRELLPAIRTRGARSSLAARSPRGLAGRGTSGKIRAATALTAAALYGGTVAAADYPPSAPPTTVLASSSHGDAQPDLPAPSGQLPSTGNSDTATIIATPARATFSTIS